MVWKLFPGESENPNKRVGLTIKSSIMIHLDLIQLLLALGTVLGNIDLSGLLGGLPF